MTILNQLIQSTHFAQAAQIWQNDAQTTVFEPFFACMLVDLLNPDGAAFYHNFITQTQSSAEFSLKSGNIQPILQIFWQERTEPLLAHIHHDSGIDSKILQNTLPLAVHTAFDVLHELGYAGQADFIESHLSYIVPFLPSWADAALGDGTSAQRQVDNLLTQSLLHTQLDDIQIPKAPADTLTDDALKDKTQDTINTPTDTPPNTTSTQTPKTPVMDNATVNSPKNDTKIDENIAEDIDEESQEIPAYRATTPSKISLAIAAALFIACVGVGFFAYQKYYANTETTTPSAQATPTPDITTPAESTQKTPASLLISVNERGDLYACHAELGTQAQFDALMDILQNSFAQAHCTVDINESVSGVLIGQNKLPSILGIIKSAPFATLDLRGNQIYIHAADETQINRLTQDIGTLLPSAQVQKTPETALISQRAEQSFRAIGALNDQSSAYQIAKALYLPLFANQTAVGDNELMLLSTAAPILKSHPDMRFIIAVHSDDTGDAAGARINTQTMAESIYTTLLAQGVSPDQLVAYGAGFDFPRTENQTEIGRTQNRRAEFLVYDEGVLQALRAPKEAADSANNAQIAWQNTDPQDTHQDAYIPSMPDYTATPNDVPTLAVHNNQIVQINEPSTYSPPASSGYISSEPNEFTTPSYSAPASSTNSQIPEDLLTPIGSDPALPGIGTRHQQ